MTAFTLPISSVARVADSIPIRLFTAAETVFRWTKEETCLIMPCRV